MYYSVEDFFKYRGNDYLNKVYSLNNNVRHFKSLDAINVRENHERFHEVIDIIIHYIYSGYFPKHILNLPAAMDEYAINMEYPNMVASH